MSNSSGSYQTTEQAMMKAYDKLPMLVRMALANCCENYVPQPLLTMLRRGRSELDVIRIVQDWNEQGKAEHWYKMDRLLRNGMDYNVPVRRRRNE